MKIRILHGAEGARCATGITVILDVFRAFSVESMLFQNGAEQVYATGEVKTALRLKEEKPDAVLIGERNGRKIDGFDYGNSPSSLRNVNMVSCSAIHTTSAGTQGIFNAVHAETILCACLNNASATASYILQRKPDVVSIVAMGWNGIRRTEEDELCAAYIRSLLLLRPDPAICEKADKLRLSEGKKFFDPAQQDVFPQADFDCCVDVDCSPYAIVSEVRGDVAINRKVNSMQKKYFFFDIDGTLTDDRTHRIVPSAARTVQRLVENGHFVSIATGRAHYKTVSVAKKLGIVNLVCCGGGCLVLQDQVIENLPLPRTDAEYILNLAFKEGRGVLIATEDSDRAVMKNFAFLQQAGFRKELTTYDLEPDLSISSIKQIMKIYLALREEEESAHPEYMSIPHLRMTKEYIVYQYDAKKDGILRMMSVLKAPVEDVVVFGDGANDVVMADPCWTTIAMGNACAAFKNVADEVTEKNVEDGIEKACLRHGWI